MGVKYIFLDIDGTLVDYYGKMPDSARVALLRASERGCKLILATGRLRGQIYPWLTDAIPFDGFITSSGAHVRCGGVNLTQFFSRAQLKRLSEHYRRLGAPALYHTDESLVTTERELEAVNEFFEKAGYRRSELSSLFGTAEFRDVTELDNIEKSVYYDSGMNTEQMSALIGGDFRIDAYSYKNIPSTCGEVTLAGVSKAVAIEALTERLGIRREDTVAFGDGGNDLAMLRCVGTGVAMGNGTDELKAEADLVTDDINSDGLANALERLKLI